jgi:predicted metal-dependent enzyme (double-stranded beta helix superfamily)
VSESVLLDNERVTVRRRVIAPGAPARRSLDDHLWVIIKGGILKAGEGRETMWREGRVIWCDDSLPILDDSINSGTVALEVVAVHVKPVTPSVSARSTAYLHYPNIPGEDLLDNERVIVQRFVVAPGQWEGVHGHQANMLYIHVKGGQWAARSQNEPARAADQASPDGSVGWMPTIDISEGHESGNAGDGPIDLIWVTLKD